MRSSGKPFPVTAVLILSLLAGLSCATDEVRTPTTPHTYTDVRMFLTARDTDDRITEQAPARFETLDQPEENYPTIILDPDKTFQTIVGFGGALTDASAETYYKMPPDKREEIITALFDPEEGNGFTFCRTNIHSCDFSSASYTYDDVAGDTELENFSIEHDLEYRIPFIRDAIEASGGNLDLFASPWSPPAWMKSNGDMLHGGTLLPEYRQTWADYFVRFVKEYEAAGVPIWGLTVQNEPMATQRWESCIFTAGDERDFVRDYLGPTLEQAGLSRLKLMVWDHNRGIMYQRAQVVYDDPEAAKYVWGTGFHWYVSDTWDNVRLVHDAWPDKNLVFTEGTVASFNRERLDDWRWGEQYARNIIHDLNNWANGWVFWNVLLDERGGPNHVGNFCMAPIIGDTRTGEVIYLNSHWYLGHFSKFIRKGAKRIVCSSNTDNLLSTAFVNPDGSIAVVVANFGERERDYQVWLDGSAARAVSPGHSIITMVLE